MHKLSVSLAVLLQLSALGCTQEPDYEIETAEASIGQSLAYFEEVAEELINADEEARKEIVCRHLEDVLETPFVQRVDSFLSRPAFFISGASSAGAVVVGKVAGADLVYDLWEHEASFYTFTGNDYSGRIGGELTASVGFAGGLDEGLLGWEGTFRSTSVGLGGVDPFPIAQLGGSVGGFWGVGNAIEGFYAQASIGADFTEVVPGLKSVAFSYQDSKWTMWEEANEAVLDSVLGRVLGLESASYFKSYMRFKRGKPALVPSRLWPSWGYYTGSGMRMGAAIVAQTAILVGPVAAFDIGAFPVVLGVLRDLGYDSPLEVVEELCR